MLYVGGWGGNEGGFRGFECGAFGNSAARQLMWSTQVPEFFALYIHLWQTVEEPKGGWQERYWGATEGHEAKRQTVEYAVEVTWLFNNGGIIAKFLNSSPAAPFSIDLLSRSNFTIFSRGFKWRKDFLQPSSLKVSTLIFPIDQFHCKHHGLAFQVTDPC